MNLRVIKKDIEYFVGEFIASIAIRTTYIRFIDEAVDLYNDLKDKVNHPAEGVKPSVHFAALRKEMFEKLDELCEKLSAVVSK